MIVRASAFVALAMLMTAQPAAAQRSLPVCSDSMPVTGDTTRGGYMAPQVRGIVMPPVGYPKSMNGGTLEVRFLVNTEGVPDSFYVVGFVDPKYEKTLREAFLQYRFRPAAVDGCRRQGWSTQRMSFGPLPGRAPPTRQPAPPLKPLPPPPLPSSPPRP